MHKTILVIIYEGSSRGLGVYSAGILHSKSWVKSQAKAIGDVRKSIQS